MGVCCRRTRTFVNRTMQQGIKVGRCVAAVLEQSTRMHVQLYMYAHIHSKLMSICTKFSTCTRVLNLVHVARLDQGHS